MKTLIILDEVRTIETPASADGDDVRVEGGVVAALGWALEERGLCRGDVCIPVRDPGLVADGWVSLRGLATALGRPLALDFAEEVACLAAAAADRAASLAGLEAPAFTLPDLGGAAHSLADHRGSKVLLAAWASW